MQRQRPERGHPGRSERRHHPRPARAGAAGAGGAVRVGAAGICGARAFLRALRRERPSAKRALDLVLGSVLLALAAPLLVAGTLALAARRPPGGVLIRSPRIGLGGHPFVLCSLRTRRLRLDLLSRLPHVVRGDLSLVGPEPLPPDDERVRTPATGTGTGTGTPDAPGEATVGTPDAPPEAPADATRKAPDTAPTPATAARHWRQELRPGLTGLAQVRSRSGMPWDEPALLDQHYAEHHWVGLDLAILAGAVHAPLRRAILGLVRHGKAHLSDTDHRRSNYSAAE
ncbi:MULTISPECIES: sugar transferase [unclassified Streptomyces]|uniref:sugar transferase n=1 Tax=unclassified Streptomyces TaxID=2593676 RepID=UPI0036E728D6